jgi:hypothetical protein
MDLAEEYLSLNDGYARYLGGLRWAPACDAVDLADGSTYAFSFQIGSFLEGYLTAGPLIHFGYVLHALGLLRRREPDKDDPPRQMRQAFQLAGRSHRNAGAFFATLCRDVPPAPGPPLGTDLLWRLQYPPNQPPALDPRHTRAGTAPPRPPEWFDAHIHKALDPYSFEDLLHWFRHGTGPVKNGEPLARAVTTRPPSLSGVLAELARNPRLSGALPYVNRFVSALTLPRRKLDRHELPTGGYDDITTRGDLAQVIPAQLALDPDEFVRRFAGNELLFFRREEPHARTRDELLVLLDQGVRTWGTTRLMLAAAALALGRYAERRRLTLRFAATSGAATLDPLTVEPATLGALVEASDLSPHPGSALERVLEETTSAPCDVVLLTHPRNLAEQDVAAAARKTARGVRLFALTVIPEGDAELSELRRGSPVSVSRFRVEAESVPLAAVVPPACTEVGDWAGDVESVPFPFRFGIATQHGPMSFAFDYSGEWLLVATSNGMLHAVRTDGSTSRIWPRPASGGHVMQSVRAVVGVAGGFVVAGRLKDGLLAAHYDIASRTCRLLAPAPLEACFEYEQWWYDRNCHTVATEITGPLCERTGKLWSLNLTTGRGESIKGAGPGSIPERVASRFFLPLRTPASKGTACAISFRSVEYASASEPLEREDTPWPAVMFEQSTGTLTVGGVANWGRFTPQSDGQPALAGCTLRGVDCRGRTLAAVVVDPRRTATSRTVRLFHAPKGAPAAEYAAQGAAFTLSDDGRLLAFQVARNRVEVRDTTQRGEALCASPVGRFHPHVDVLAGAKVLRVDNGAFQHVVRWDSGRLHCLVAAGPFDRSAQGLAVTNTKLPDWVTDKKRFVRCLHNGLTVVVDVFGEVLLFDSDRKLVCMLFTFRNRIAAWTPDGTRFGHETLLGMDPTPGAAEKIGAALLAASNRSGQRSLA